MISAHARPVTHGFGAGIAFLASGAALTGTYFLLAKGGTPQSALYDVIGVASSLAIAAGVRLHRPSRPLPWLLFALGNLFFAVADIIFNFAYGGSPPVPSVADAFYLAGYPLLVAGLVLLLLHAGGRYRTAALGDAAIVTVVFALLQWTFEMSSIVSGSGSAWARAIGAAYPGMDVILLAGLAGFFVTALWRSPAFVLLVASIVALLIADEVYGIGPSSYRSGDWIDGGWLLSYVLWAVAALHPSMRELSEQQPRRSARVSGWRIALLTGALVAAPVLLFVQWLRDARLEIPAVVIAAVAVAVLVMLRLTAILRVAERLRVRERQARADAIAAQVKLAAHNEQLVEADRVKDEFVALISHDLRTPLTSIIGYIELALDEETPAPLDAERQGYLEVVARSSQRLLRLVDDLLFVARLRTGRLELTPAEVDLSEIAAQTVAEMRPRAERQGLTLSLDAPAPVRLEADRGRLFQLLDNVVSNAIKFTPAGGSIELAVGEAAGRVSLEVRDTGIGIGAGEAERVFEQFFRARAAVQGQIQGTGLGLFISRAIVEVHGGSITAAPRDGGGTVFHIELPVRAAIPTAELVS
ncbi:MAG TPA: HAMP domain-containing sensor histidine kinase [Gaiellaceae bacterium]|nr:HAMP domain-containing sensor histidine kinase [Gaiellaceae bacterium]